MFWPGIVNELVGLLAVIATAVTNAASCRNPDEQVPSFFTFLTDQLLQHGGCSGKRVCVHVCVHMRALGAVARVCVCARVRMHFLHNSLVCKCVCVAAVAFAIFAHQYDIISTPELLCSST